MSTAGMLDLTAEACSVRHSLFRLVELYLEHGDLKGSLRAYRKLMHRLDGLGDDSAKPGEHVQHSPHNLTEMNCLAEIEVYIERVYVACTEHQLETKVALKLVALTRSGIEQLHMPTGERLVTH